MNRRNFLKTAGLATAAVPAIAVSPSRLESRSQSIKLAIASYSYWHFRTEKVPIETVIRKAAEIGVEAVDILHRQMDLDEKGPLDAAGRAYLRQLKRQAFLNGLSICCLSTHQSFVSPNRNVISDNVNHTIKCIEIAHELGCPCIRINTGRWGTSKDFDELMKNRGVEPVLPGYTETDGFKWCMDGIARCLPKAEECGVILALENHWGLARTPEGLLHILNGIGSPWLGGLMDTGNFLFPPFKEAAYEALTLIAPKSVYVQAKTYPGGGEWYELDINYKRIARMLRDTGYSGYVALEMEGKEHPNTAVPKDIKMLRKAFQQEAGALFEGKGGALLIE